MKPKNRTIVFRGFKKCPGTKKKCLKFVTDSRSEKIKELGSNPSCEIVWWFPGTSEQYRITGDVDVVTDQSDEEQQFVRESLWNEMSNPGREAFYRPAGNIIINQTNKEELTEVKVPAGGRDGDGNVLPVPKTFVVLLVWTDTIKYLNLKGNFAQIDRHTENSWTSELATP